MPRAAGAEHAAFARRPSTQMLSASCTPAPPLDTLIAKLWVFEGRNFEHSKERVLPDGCMELVINLREDCLRVYDRDACGSFQTFSGALICGAHSEFFVIDTACQANVLGVHFKPGGGQPLIGMPADELHGRHVALEDLWGSAARAMRDRLLDTPSAADKFRILESTLLALAGTDWSRHPSIDFGLQALRAAEGASVSAVSERVGLSRRRFAQIFREHVGLTPKRYFRIRRFNEVLSAMRDRNGVDLAELALTCGYYDQSHFNHDFKLFSGVTPCDYLLLKGDHLGHLPLPDPAETVSGM